jgi:hypothetical protein
VEAETQEAQIPGIHWTVVNKVPSIFGGHRYIESRRITPLDHEPTAEEYATLEEEYRALMAQCPTIELNLEMRRILVPMEDIRVANLAAHHEIRVADSLQFIMVDYSGQEPVVVVYEATYDAKCKREVEVCRRAARAFASKRREDRKEEGLPTDDFQVLLLFPLGGKLELVYGDWT